MKRLSGILTGLVTSISLAGCADDEAPRVPVEPTEALVGFECQASPQNFVRKAILAVQGRRAWGQAEINAYEDYFEAVENAGGDPKSAVVRILASEGAFRERWADVLMDHLLADRLNIAQKGYQRFEQKPCFRPPSAQPTDEGELAAWVRDNYPSATDPPLAEFDMGHLLSSSIELDDLSPVYRANLFTLLRFPMAAPNVSDEDRERTRRADFGSAFETVYIRRDPTCTACHNGAFSVTYDADENANRHWALPGLFEEALFGASTGPGDPLISRSVMRHVGVGDVEGGVAPYGWNVGNCGTFAVPSEADPLDVEVRFGSIRSTPENPALGKRASVWALDPALRRGVDLLARDGLVMDAAGRIADPDAAFAYLVGASIVEEVWSEVVGSELSSVTGFPRSRVQRDTLKELTDAFVASRFSLKGLLADIAAHPAFNLSAPDEGCGGGAYEIPTIFDAWTTQLNEDGLRVNSAADGLFALTSRTLRRGVHRAMSWPAPESFPKDDELSFQTTIGNHIRRGQRGVRGLSFEGRLAWEQQYGACRNLSDAPDFIDELVAAAAGTKGLTLTDAIIALKDRLLNEPSVSEEESAALEGLIGRRLDEVFVDGSAPAWEESLRSVCGALLQSPQLFLGGIAVPDHDGVPVLTPPSHDYRASCEAIRAASQALGEPQSINCEGTLRLER